jgi:hypothetical protein
MAKRQSRSEEQAAKAAKSAENPKPEPSAAPGTEAREAQEAPKGRIEYPNIPEDGLEGIPEDFDFRLHKVIKRKQFKDEANWFELKALEMEGKAKAYRKQAEDFKKLGSVKDRNKAKRLVQMRNRMAELMAELKAGGTDVEALLADEDEE